MLEALGNAQPIERVKAKLRCFQDISELLTPDLRNITIRIAPNSKLSET